MAISRDIENYLDLILRLDLSQARARPLLNGVAEHFGEKRYRVRAAYRLRRLARQKEEKQDDEPHRGAPAPPATPPGAR